LCHVLEVLDQTLCVLRSHFHLLRYTFGVGIESPPKRIRVVASLDASSAQRAISNCMRSSQWQPACCQSSSSSLCVADDCCRLSLGRTRSRRSSFRISSSSVSNSSRGFSMKSISIANSSSGGISVRLNLPPQPLCHGRPWLATLRACCDPSGCQDARASTIKPLPNAMSAPLSVRSCDG
jgi:hypothetical protein